MKPALSVLVCILLAVNAQARLGETVDQVHQRYGNPTENPKILSAREKSASYTYGDFLVEVTFFDGKSQSEVFSIVGSGRPFAAQEIQAIQRANSFGGEWREWPTESSSREWTLGTGVATCFYLKDASDPPERVSLITKQYLAFMLQKAREAQQNKLNGL